MRDCRGRSLWAGHARAIQLTAGVFLAVTTARCSGTGPGASEKASAVLRVGAGQIELAPFIQNLTIEGLGTVTDEGKLDARLAKQWTVAPDGLSIAIQLRSGVRFHDHSAVTAQIVAQILQKSLPDSIGAAYDDVSSITAPSDDLVEVKLRRPSPFVLEALETPISKPGSPGIGTGNFHCGDLGQDARCGRPG